MTVLDDPSNVYHSYMGDHVVFRILHAGANITHVHHQHAHQWLHSPNSDESDYRDSQMLSPGGAYTLDQGKSLTLKYRVILHRGDEKQAGIAEAFAAYAK